MYQLNFVLDIYKGWIEPRPICVPEGCPVIVNIALKDGNTLIDIPNMTLDIKLPNKEIMTIVNNETVIFNVPGMHYIEIDTQLDEQQRIVSGYARFHVRQTIKGMNS